MSKKQLVVVLMILILPAFALQVYAKPMYENGEFIYIIDIKGKKLQITFKGRDYEPKLSPDGKRIIFIRAVKDCPFTEDLGWFPLDFDEVWSVNIDGSNERCIIKNNYSEKPDMNNYLGCFDDLNFSPDGKYIYFLCQNCASNAVLYRANSDGTNIKRLCSAYEVDVIGGNPEDEYYGYIVAGVKKNQEDTGVYKWTSVILDSDGNEVREIDDLDGFWKHYKLY